MLLPRLTAAGPLRSDDHLASNTHTSPTPRNFFSSFFQPGMYIVCVCVYSTHLDANCCTAAEPVHKCETVPAEFSYPPCNEVNYALSLCVSRDLIIITRRSPTFVILQRCRWFSRAIAQSLHGAFIFLFFLFHVNIRSVGERNWNNSRSVFFFSYEARRYGV